MMLIAAVAYPLLTTTCLLILVLCCAGLPHAISERDWDATAGLCRVILVATLVLLAVLFL